MVDAAVGQQQLDRKAWIALLQRWQQGREDMPAEGGAAGDAQPAGRRGIRVGDGCLCTLQVALDMAHLRQVQRATFGEGQLAGGAVEQAHAQVGFQAGDVLAHRGRADAQGACGGGQAAGIGGADETAEGLEDVHAGAHFPGGLPSISL